MWRKKGAFTLVELLVVIVVIGILATISIATYGGYQEKARKSKHMIEAREKIKQIRLCDLGFSNANCSFSEQTCAELGWGVYNSTIDINAVNTYADCGDSICDEGVNWEEANEKCLEVDARLCTIDEVRNRIPYGSGCGWDSRMIWTMTPCNGGFYISKGRFDAESNIYCQQDIFNTKSEGGYLTNSDMAVRCCADNAPS